MITGSILTNHGSSTLLLSSSISSSCSLLQSFRHSMMKRLVHLHQHQPAVHSLYTTTTTATSTTLPLPHSIIRCGGGGGGGSIVPLVLPKRSIHGHIVMNTFQHQTTTRMMSTTMTGSSSSSSSGSLRTNSADSTTVHQKNPYSRLLSTASSRVLSINRGGSSSITTTSDGRSNGRAGSSSITTATNSTAEYITDTYQTVYVAVGSNMGNRFGHIMAALTKLEESTIGDYYTTPLSSSSASSSSTSPSSSNTKKDNTNSTTPTIQHIQTSFLRETPPMYVTNQPPFLNAVLQLQTNLSPHALLSRLKEIESQLGRDLQNGVRNGPRPVDLDILVYGNGTKEEEEGGVVSTKVLEIPHPRMGEREFVLEPLCDLNRGLVIPNSGGGGSGTTADEMLRALFADVSDTEEEEEDTTTTTNTKTEPPPEPSAVLVLPLPRNRMLALNTTVIMGILNTTPDSFSDGGIYNTSLDCAVAHALQMVTDGAGIIDIGGESTRPGAVDVELEMELERVIPVIRRVREISDIPISIDTRNAKVAKAAIEAGADIINDVSGGLHDPLMLPTVAQLQVPIILMHMRGTPQTMQTMTKYDDVVTDVANALLARSKAAEAVGIPRWLQVLDPGIGFAKDLDGNLSLLKGVMGRRLRTDGGLLDGFPILLGPSRKGFIGKLIGEESDPERRDFGTVAACVLGSLGGSSERKLGISGTILRVHNVKAVKNASVIMEAILNAN